MYKILVVEDEPDTAKVIRKRLSDRGFEVLVADDAYLGVELARNEKPDLIILDLMLPAGGGMTVLKNVRLSAYSRDIPVVILTGIKDEDYKKKVLNEGVDAYLEKPYDADTLITTVQNILAKRPKRE